MISNLLYSCGLLLCMGFVCQGAMPELVAYATDMQHPELGLLCQTARWHGWRALHVIGSQAGYNKHMLVDKLRALRRFAKNWPDETILVFVDGYDVVMNNEPAKLESAFLASGRRVVVASELGCCCSKATAMAFGSACQEDWPFLPAGNERKWLNSGVIVGYARDIRKFLKLAWKEYLTNPPLYHMYTDQLLVCFLLTDGSNIWSRASVGIDHASNLAVTTYQTDVRIGQVLGLDDIGRVVFANRTIPCIIHFNGPKKEKMAQMAYAKTNFPLVHSAMSTGFCETVSHH